MASLVIYIFEGRCTHIGSCKGLCPLQCNNWYLFTTGPLLETSFFHLKARVIDVFDIYITLEMQELADLA